MNAFHRRDALRLAAASGAAVLAGSTADAASQKSKPNSEAPVASQAKADNRGPMHLFAVVDRDGKLQRGMNAVSAKRIDVGTYEVIFNRDVRRGVYQATGGGHGFEGMPISSVANVIGRANDPRGVLVYTVNMTNDPLDVGFHLLVVCPEGHA